jgi:hypothetical protein
LQRAAGRTPPRGLQLAPYGELPALTPLGLWLRPHAPQVFVRSNVILATRGARLRPRWPSPASLYRGDVGHRNLQRVWQSCLVNPASAVIIMPPSCRPHACRSRHLRQLSNNAMVVAHESHLWCRLQCRLPLASWAINSCRLFSWSTALASPDASGALRPPSPAGSRRVPPRRLPPPLLLRKPPGGWHSRLPAQLLQLPAPPLSPWLLVAARPGPQPPLLAAQVPLPLSPRLRPGLSWRLVQPLPEQLHLASGQSLHQPDCSHHAVQYVRSAACRRAPNAAVAALPCRRIESEPRDPNKFPTRPAICQAVEVALPRSTVAIAIQDWLGGSPPARSSRLLQETAEVLKSFDGRGQLAARDRQRPARRRLSRAQWRTGERRGPDRGTVDATELWHRA